MGYEMLRRPSSARADVGITILFPRLISGFEMNAGEYALYDLRKTLLMLAFPLPTLELA
jgi:hypothetical protein